MRELKCNNSKQLKGLASVIVNMLVKEFICEITPQKVKRQSSKCINRGKK